MNKDNKQQEQKCNVVLPCVSGSFSFGDMANFAIWIKNNFSNEIVGAFARRSDGNLYWDEQVGELVKIWYENYR
mgnify:FL=1